MTLSTPIGIVDLDHTTQPPVVVTLLHHLQQLMLHTPRRLVRHTEMAHELERGDAVFLLREEEHGQGSRRQRELGRGEDRPGGHRGLMVTVTTLQERPRAQPQRPCRVSAVPTDEPLRPAPALKRVSTLRFGAELPHEALQAQTLLKLDRVLRHSAVPMWWSWGQSAPG